MKKTILCTVCPQGCEMTVTGEPGAIQSVSGNRCKRGLAYAESEFTCPVRTLTSTVRVTGGARPLVAVRSTGPIPRRQLLECMARLRCAAVPAGTAHGQVVIHNILGSGADIITTADA